MIAFRRDKIIYQSADKFLYAREYLKKLIILLDFSKKWLRHQIISIYLFNVKVVHTDFFILSTKVFES